MKRKILALLMVLCFIAGTVPVSAMGVGTCDTYKSSNYSNSKITKKFVTRCYGRTNRWMGQNTFDKIISADQSSNKKEQFKGDESFAFTWQSDEEQRLKIKVSNCIFSYLSNESIKTKKAETKTIKNANLRIYQYSKKTKKVKRIVNRSIGDGKSYENTDFEINAYKGDYFCFVIDTKGISTIDTKDKAGRTINCNVSIQKRADNDLTSSEQKKIKEYEESTKSVKKIFDINTWIKKKK